ncbi:hypothetical protein HYY70_01990 [Candidatus Woesearchaeota archaeon]|nr:hypothetical protein [Candidatus Woesearchaeota archaeon]
MSKIENYSFYNIPKKYTAADYDNAISRIIKKYSKIKGLVSIYDWGKPSVYGISDIDIVLVFENEFQNALPFLYRSFYFLDSNLRYIARHPFIFIDKESFKNIRYIYPKSSLKLIYGKDVKIKKLSKFEEYYSSIAALNDIIIRHYPRDFLWQQVSKQINARDTMLRLNSLKYSIQALEFLTKEKNPEWNEKLDLIDHLRKKWFGSEDYLMLAKLNEDGLNTSLEIIGKFADFIAKKDIAKISPGSTAKYEGIKNRSIFIKNWSKENALNYMVKNAKRKEKQSTMLPIELAAQLKEYSKYGGLISCYIKNNLKDKLEYELKNRDILKERIKILNKQAGLALNLKHSDFAAFFDFGYRNKSGINNFILNLLDKLRF